MAGVRRNVSPTVEIHGSDGQAHSILYARPRRRDTSATPVGGRMNELANTRRAVRICAPDVFTRLPPRTIWSNLTLVYAAFA